ncbi:MAG TPA: hypothetical protein VNJ09_00645 [Chthonomonadales bacterium]|nr:hypothetical protein [Chthonomonadales bacterium]
MWRRADHNQAEIVVALRRLGASVFVLSDVGHGCPDLLVGFRGRTFLLEVKNMRGRGRRLTPQQVEFHQGWQGAPIRTVTNAAEAEKILLRMLRTRKRKGGDGIDRVPENFTTGDP